MPHLLACGDERLSRMATTRRRTASAIEQLKNRRPTQIGRNPDEQAP